MNTLRIIICGLSIMTIVSCKDTNVDRTDDAGVEIAPTEDDALHLEKAEGTKGDIDTEEVFRTQDMTDMYSELNMTEEQIEQFQDDYRQKLNNRSSDNIVDHNLIDLQMDESLKAVLNPEQYSKYQEWKKSNPAEK